MRRFWRWWTGLFRVRETAEPLALVRMAAGLCVVGSVVTVLPHGLWRVLWLDAGSGGYRDLAGAGGHPLWQWLGTPGAGVVAALMAGAITGGVGMAAGLFTRWSTAVALLCFNLLIQVNPHDGSAYDSLLTNLLWLLLLSGAGATWSLDCRRRGGGWCSDERVAAWPRYLMLVQLIVMYGTTGLQKVSSHWVPGGDFAALYYILQDPFWQRFGMEWTAEVFWLTQIGTAATWLWEVGAFLLIPVFWFRHTRGRPGRLRRWSNRLDLRTWYALIGIVFHVAIMVMMRVGPFSWIALAYYPAFWSGPEYGRLRARRRASRAGSRPAGSAARG